MIEPYFFDAHIFATLYEFQDLIYSAIDMMYDERISQSTRTVIQYELLPEARKMRANCEQALVENRGKL